MFKQGDSSTLVFFCFFCKNKLYKNNEADTGQKIRTNLEHFEAGKCKDKKKNKNDELYFFITPYKRMT